MKATITSTKSPTQLTNLAMDATGHVTHDRLPTDSPALASYVAARTALEQRQIQLEQELADIQTVLRGEANPPAPAKIPVPAVPLAARRSRPNRGLTKAVVSVLANGPLTKDQIVSVLKAQNFPFFGSPKPALDPVLYGKKFKREGKLFRLGVAHE